MTDFYLNERVMQLRVEEEHRQAELRRQQETSGAGRTNWLGWQRNRALSWWGYLLASAGQRLLASVEPPHPSAEEA